MRRAVWGLFVIVLLTAPAVAWAAPPAASVTVLQGSPAQLGWGNKLTVAGDGFAADESVAVRIDRATLLSVTADATGHVVASVTIPNGTMPGQHELLLRGQRSKAQAALPLFVVVTKAASPPATQAPPLAVTGPRVPLLSAVALLVVGAVLVAMGTPRPVRQRVRADRSR